MVQNVLYAIKQQDIILILLTNVIQNVVMELLLVEIKLVMIIIQSTTTDAIQRVLSSFISLVEDHLVYVHFNHQYLFNSINQLCKQMYAIQ